MYVVFEGVDGTGKTTQINRVRWKLQEKIDTIITIAEKEIDTSNSTAEGVFLEYEKALRYALQRCELWDRLDRRLSYSALYGPNTILLSDRSYYSSMAYQGIYINPIELKRMNDFVPEPDLIFFFDNGEQEGYLELVRKQYYKVLPLNTVVVNTRDYTFEETADYIVNKIWEWVEKWEKNMHPFMSRDE